MEKHREEYHCPRGLFPPHLTPTHTRILHYFPFTFSVSSQVPWFICEEWPRNRASGLLLIATTWQRLGS